MRCVISCAAQNLGGAYAKAMIFAQAANMTGLLLSETGGNKSGMLEFFLAATQDYMALYGQEFMLTDFTTEALCSAMADNAGRVLVTMHEAKKLFFADQYKVKGDGKERLMEFQDGVAAAVGRKGGAADADDEPEPKSDDAASDDDEEKKEKKKTKKKKRTVHIEHVRAHFNMSGCSHPQLGETSIAREEVDPIGCTARMSLALLPAKAYELPAKAKLIELMEGINKFPKMSVVMAIVTIFSAMVFEQRADGPKAEFAFIYLNDEAYGLLQAFFSEIKAKIDAITGATLSGINNSLQVSAYSKAKGNALKYSGAMYLLAMAWTLCEDNEKLLNFEGTLVELESIVAPLLESIVTANDARGGDIDAESMKRGIAWAVYFMEQQLALQNQVVEAGSDEEEGCTQEKKRTKLVRRLSDSVSIGQALHIAAKRPPQKDYSSHVAWAASSMMRSEKTEPFVVSASWMTKGDPAHLNIGENASTAGVTFIEAAKHLEQEGLGELFDEIVTAEAAPAGATTGATKSRPNQKKWYFKFYDLSLLVLRAREPEKTLKEMDTKLIKYKIESLDIYTRHMRAVIDFAKLAAAKPDTARRALRLAQIPTYFPAAAPITAPITAPAAADAAAAGAAPAAADAPAAGAAPATTNGTEENVERYFVSAVAVEEAEAELAFEG